MKRRLAGAVLDGLTYGYAGYLVVRWVRDRRQARLTGRSTDDRG